jgi:hypothetical protein
MAATTGKFRIEQSATYAGDDWWNWEVWIEGKDADLDTIDYVVYTLHSTFVRPVRQMNNRESKFILKEEGWGTFTIYVKLFLKNKTTIQLQHDLVLLYPDGEKLIEQRNKSFEVKDDIHQHKGQRSKRIFIFLGVGLVLAFLLFILIRSFNKSGDQNTFSGEDYDARDTTIAATSSNDSTIKSSINTNDDEKTKTTSDSLSFNIDRPVSSRMRSNTSITIDQTSTSFNYNVVYGNNGDTSVRNTRDLILKLLERETQLIRSMDEEQFRKKYTRSRRD